MLRGIYLAPLQNTSLRNHGWVDRRVDMGAYEFGIGDYDCNQTVNLNDLSAWPTCATDPLGLTEISISTTSNPQPGAPNSIPDCSSFDFDADSDIDLSDLAQFLLVLNP